MSRSYAKRGNLNNFNIRHSRTSDAVWSYMSHEKLCDNSKIGNQAMKSKMNELLIYFLAILSMHEIVSLVSLSLYS